MIIQWGYQVANWNSSAGLGYAFTNFNITFNNVYAVFNSLTSEDYSLYTNTYTAQQYHLTYIGGTSGLNISGFYQQKNVPHYYIAIGT